MHARVQKPWQTVTPGALDQRAAVKEQRAHKQRQAVVGPPEPDSATRTGSHRKVLERRRFAGVKVVLGLALGVA